MLPNGHLTVSEAGGADIQPAPDERNERADGSIAMHGHKTHTLGIHLDGRSLALRHTSACRSLTIENKAIF